MPRKLPKAASPQTQWSPSCHREACRGGGLPRAPGPGLTWAFSSQPDVSEASWYSLCSACVREGTEVKLSGKLRQVVRRGMQCWCG